VVSTTTNEEERDRWGEAPELVKKGGGESCVVRAKKESRTLFREYTVWPQGRSAKIIKKKKEVEGDQTVKI